MAENTETSNKDAQHKDAHADDALATRMKEATSDATGADVKTDDDAQNASTADHTENVVAPDGQISNSVGNRADGSDTGGVM